MAASSTRPLASYGPCELADFDYELPHERHRPDADRAARRGPAARRPGRRRARAPHVRDLRRRPAPGRPARGQRDQGDPGPAALRRGTGGAAEVLLLEPIDGERRTWEALVRPARKLQPGEMLYAPDGTPVVEIGGRTEAGDTFTVSLVGSVDSLDLLGRARRDAAAAVHHRAARPARPLPDGVRPRAGQRRRADGRAALHARAARRARRPRASSVRPSSWWSGSTRSGRSAPTTRSQHRMHTERYRVPAETMGAVPRRRAGGRRRHHLGAGAGVGGAARASWRAAPTSSSTAGHDWQVVDLMMTNFHLPRTTLLMMIDAFVGARWRTLYAEALRRGLPLPAASATRCCSTAARLTGRRSVASPGVHPVRLRDRRHRRHRPSRGRHDGERLVHDAAVHAGRHPRRGQVPERRRLRRRSAPRSCSATRTT